MREHLDAASHKLASLERLLARPDHDIDPAPPITDNSCGGVPSSLKRELLNCNDSGKIAFKLASHFFTDAERINRNVMGRRGKEGLDPLKITKIRTIFFSFSKVHPNFEKSEWSRAVRKIDEATCAFCRTSL